MKIVVDTDKYSGNFEREMCAFATAQVGECGVGEDEVDPSHPYATWWEENIVQVNDNGCYRPVAISPTVGYINDGMGGHYKDTPENRQFAHKNAVDKLIAYHAAQREQLEARLRDGNFEEDNGGRGWTQEACLRTLKNIDDHIELARKRKNVHPAYQSIEIHVNAVPPGIVMMDFESRVHAFAENNNLEILGIHVRNK